jgi:penicillin-binding protein 1A
MLGRLLAALLSDSLHTGYKPSLRRLIFLSKILVALAVGMTTVGYLLRTEFVLRPMVQSNVESRLGKTLTHFRFTSFKPSGWCGIVFEDVSFSASLGRWSIHGDVQELQVKPSLWTLFREAHLRPTDLRVFGGKVHVRSQTGARRIGTGQPSNTEVSAPPSVSVVLENLLVGVHLDEADARMADFELTRLDLDLAGAGIANLRGYGRFPDQAPFRVYRNKNRDKSSWTVAAENSTDVLGWFPGRFDASIHISHFDTCIGCEGANRIGVSDVRLSAPSVFELELLLGSGQMSIQSKSLEWAGDELALLHPRFGISGTRVIQSQFKISRDLRRLAGSLSMSNPVSGQVDIDWSLEDRVWTALVSAAGFSDHEVRALWSDRPEIPALSDVHGTIAIRHEVATGHLTIRPDLRFGRLDWNHPLLASEPVRIDDLALWANIGGELKKARASLEGGHVTVKDLGPITFNAAAENKDEAIVFRTSVSAKDLEAERLRDALPRALRRAMDKSVYTGSLGFELRAEGSTADPEKVAINGALTSDIRVISDDAANDVRALGRSGRPPILDDKFGKRVWFSLPHFPPRAIDALLAAEDHAFFVHDGFDRKGLGRALGKNLAGGSIIQGGSTISQQVAKNLFLNADRSLSRKFQEAYLTWRLEAEVSKERILEIYLNFAPWGPDVFGMDEAVRHHLDITLQEAGIAELALVSSLLPNPTRFGSWIEAGYLPASRRQKILNILRNLHLDGSLSSQGHQEAVRQAHEGRFGQHRLEICGDGKSARKETAQKRCQDI